MNPRKKWPGVLISAGLVCTILLLMLRWFERSQVFHPSRTLEATGTELGRPFQDVFLQADDGTRLNGWFFPGGANRPGNGLVVLVCHGNGGNITHRLALANALLGTGLGVFLLDYRGYGRSEGRPTERGTYLDARAAYDWLRHQGFAPKHILVFGESLGGGVASELAASVETGGLILQSTFTSIPDVGAELFPWLPVRLLARIRYDTRSRLPRIQVPVLIMHSRADGLIDFSHSQKNFAAANEPKCFCEISGNHNDPLADRRQFLDGIEKFLQLVQKRLNHSAAESDRSKGGLRTGSAEF